MILKTTTNEFCFINVSFYETIADPRHFFEQDYEEMPEYEEESDSGYDVTILLNMYLTLAFVKEFGFKAGEAWSEITEYAYGCLSYSDFATTEMLIPEGSEHLFKDIYTAKADELYHHVLDKFGWAWRDPKYKSETELCAMLKWAKEKGLTIEELSI